MGSRVGRVDKFFSPLLLSLTESINQIFSAFHPLPSPPRARKKRGREREGEKEEKEKLGLTSAFPNLVFGSFFCFFVKEKQKNTVFVLLPCIFFWGGGGRKRRRFLWIIVLCVPVCVKYDASSIFGLSPPPLPLSKNILVFLLPNSLSVLFPAGAGGAAGLAARPPAAAAVRNGGGGFGFHPLNLQFPRPRS